MSITRMLGLRQRLHGLASPVPLAPRARISPPSAPRAYTPVPCDDCPICAPPTDQDTALALSELQGQLARTQAAILAVAQQLEARYQRYSWTEQLAVDLRAIAHGSPSTGSRPEVSPETP